jgi:hypothetical protein
MEGKKVDPIIYMDYEALNKLYLNSTGEQMAFTNMHTGRITAIEIFAPILCVGSQLM